MLLAALWPGCYSLVKQALKPAAGATDDAATTGGSGNGMVRIRQLLCVIAALALLLATAVQGMAEESPELVNLALNKQTSQSSTSFSGPSDNAVDGNTNGNFTNDSVTHTGQDTNAWWEVDLGASYAIYMVRVWNRTDCCGDRLDDAYIFVSNSPFGSDDPLTVAEDDDVHTFWIDDAPIVSEFLVMASGRYVRVQIPRKGYLSLAEVEVLQLQGALPRTVVYSTTEPTNQSVTATLTPAEGATVTNNGGSPAYIFEENGSFTFEFVDELGDEKTVEAVVGNIDKIAPVTSDDAPTEGAAGAVTVTLTASDEGSGVASTHYRIGDGEPQAGTSIVLEETGSHSLSYWSVDEAGNAEEPNHVLVTVYSKATVTELDIGEAYSILGDTVALSASVTWSAPWEPQGTVLFFAGEHLIGSAGVSDGIAVLEATDLEAGLHSITAIFEGDDNYDGSVSDTVTLEVTEAALDDLTLGDGALLYDPEVTRYVTAVAPETDALSVAPNAPVAGMILAINGELLGDDEESRDIPLQTGGNVVTVDVMDAHGAIRNTYTIVAMRPLQQQWDVSDAVRAAKTGFDVDSDGHFTGEDMEQLLLIVEPRLTEQP